MPLETHSPEGQALWRQLEDAALNEAVTAKAFTYPVLMIQSSGGGFLCACVVREGVQCEALTDLHVTGVLFPIRTLFIEQATLRTAQHLFTEEMWRAACRKWKREQRRAGTTAAGV